MVYGLGTRSYNRSAEARENKRQQAEATARFEQSQRVEIVMGLVCTCRSFNLPHSPERHRELAGDWDWSLESERSGVQRYRERVR